MKSQIILTVKHNDHEDSLDELASALYGFATDQGSDVLDWQVRVDIP